MLGHHHAKHMDSDNKLVYIVWAQGFLARRSSGAAIPWTLSVNWGSSATVLRGERLSLCFGEGQASVAFPGSAEKQQQGKG